ncbi:hypothetical protein C0Q70_02846 [Pomacea canaliculata]|uniref:Spaetzle domain-containing protein n=1 Tax=Pomacea canaliculata TaxID=400727 RepID=A0A2T7PR77_POMCA|nr:hypothetical protein C0Q70_02846 [Pomacea canaliculata]
MLKASCIGAFLVLCVLARADGSEVQVYLPPRNQRLRAKTAHASPRRHEECCSSCLGRKPTPGRTELPHPLPSHLHLKDQYLALCFETWKSGREGGCCPCAVLLKENHFHQQAFAVPYIAFHVY